MKNAGHTILILLSIVIIVLLIVILVKLYKKPTSMGTGMYGIGYTGPREGCEDTVCADPCRQKYHNDQPGYEACMKQCFTDHDQDITSCCMGQCGTLPASMRQQCYDDCNTRLYPPNPSPPSPDSKSYIKDFINGLCTGSLCNMQCSQSSNPSCMSDCMKAGVDKSKTTACCNNLCDSVVGACNSAFDYAKISDKTPCTQLGTGCKTLCV